MANTNSPESVEEDPRNFDSTNDSNVGNESKVDETHEYGEKIEIKEKLETLHYGPYKAVNSDGIFVNLRISSDYYATSSFGMRAMKSSFEETLADKRLKTPQLWSLILAFSSVGLISISFCYLLMPNFSLPGQPYFYYLFFIALSALAMAMQSKRVGRFLKNYRVYLAYEDMKKSFSDQILYEINDESLDTFNTKLKEFEEASAENPDG